MTQSTSSRISVYRRGTSSTLRRGKKERNHADTGKFGSVVTVHSDSYSLIISIFMKEKARSCAKIEGLD